MEWIPIKNQTPAFDGEFLVSFCFGGNAKLVDIMIYRKKNNQFIWDRAYTRNMTEFVRAWMPIPKVYEE